VITIGIAVVAVTAYVAEWYVLSFWVLALAIANGFLATLWSILNPDWYWKKREQAGFNPLEQFMNGRRSFVPALLAAKVPLIAVMAFAAWYVGIKAGYL
jgi:hypothetical protein